MSDTIFTKDHKLNLVTRNQIYKSLKKNEHDVVRILQKDYPEYFKVYQLCVISWGNQYLVKEKNYSKYKEEYLKELALVLAHGINTGNLILNEDLKFELNIKINNK